MTPLDRPPAPQTVVDVFRNPIYAGWVAFCVTNSMFSGGPSEDRGWNRAAAGSR